MLWTSDRGACVISNSSRHSRWWVLYERVVIDHPRGILLTVFLVTGFFVLHIPDFRLDASSESLVLQGDEALQVYRKARDQYGSDDYFIVTYTRDTPLFRDATIEELRRLRDELAAIEGVHSVNSILDVPLLQSSKASLVSGSKAFVTLESGSVSLESAQDELTRSDLYRNLLISPDAKTTALQVNFAIDETLRKLFRDYEGLTKAKGESSQSAGSAEVDELLAQIKARNTQSLKRQARNTEAVRQVLARFDTDAEVHLGGVPMIVADSITYIRRDMLTFGVAVLVFVVVLLSLVFGQLRWVLLPILMCAGTGLSMVGFLGWVDWPVTVVSSNFIALLMIITLSFSIHLIVRYREAASRGELKTQSAVVLETVRSKFHPCLYTALTTIIAFGSLMVSDIRPVIDFGWMMSVGVLFAFLYAFTLFPAAASLFVLDTRTPGLKLGSQITSLFSRLISSTGAATVVIWIVFVAVSAYGLTLLNVQNRFIDYFKPSTEIYRGMELIDQNLGGTTPFELILSAPDDFASFDEEVWADFSDDDVDFGPLDAGPTMGYWYNSFMLDQVDQVHRFLEELDDTGKVLSLQTWVDVVTELQDLESVDDFHLSLFYQKLPDELKAVLLEPYLSADGNQIRFSMRVYESDPNLDRSRLIEQVNQFLVGDLGIAPERVQLTGMMVLYNNVLRSLYQSQILTIGFVFACVFVMFLVSFRNLTMAVIAIVPNVIAAVLVLGLMGWLDIPLDIMTITIAAICVGIAVDDTIHYVHRFMLEYDGDYWGTVTRCHGTIGLAMVHTTTTITLGFSILVLSTFVPTIHFGVLTGYSMVVALVADLTLLPWLIAAFKPLGD